MNKHFFYLQTVEISFCTILSKSTLFEKKKQKKGTFEKHALGN